MTAKHQPESPPLDQLRAIVRDLGRTIIAYSGGVDSALVATVAHQELRDRSVACIGVSPSLPSRELQQALELAEQIGFVCHPIQLHEHLDRRYVANGPDRCYVCRSHLYARLADMAQKEGYRTIADGVHADDVADHQHGIRAGQEYLVRSPLREAGIGKALVRQMARDLGIAAWDKPAAACLSSRVPHGTAITPEVLRQIERAENSLANLGFRQFRVRYHGEIARIELPNEELPRALSLRQQISNTIRDAGFRFVTLDLGGFRSGSLRVLT